MNGEQNGGYVMKRGYSLRRVASALALFLIFSPPVSALTLSLHDADIQNKIVRLGDIATFSGISHSQREFLNDIVLGYAPMPGTKRVIGRDTIKVHVLSGGFHPHQITIQGDDPVVQRKGQVVSEQTIGRAVLEALTPYTADGTNFQITRIASLKKMPVGDVTFDVSLPKKIKRKFYVNVDVKVGKEKARIYVTLNAVRVGQVVVAAQKLERGDLITTSNLKVERRDIFTVPHNYFANLSDVVGKKARRVIVPGTPILSASVERDLIVRRGDKVRLIVKLPGLEISSAGESFGTGGVGDSVRVKNLRSKKFVTGRIVSSNEVVVLQ
ncbi:MAG: flagellar basal body P-ring formation protein FlgA [Candidatus Lindowbacteria bacterium]|nr:flagellar basal body P-ring formation protein FlgA [Candidatus Lindowbacteria bacterium]